jgi:RecA-family ATPase
MTDNARAEREVVVVSFSEIAEPAPREWLVEDLLPKGAPSKLYGDGGLAKSYLALHRSTTVAAGYEEWLGHRVKKFPVLYLDFELDVDEQARRAFRIARGLGLQRPPVDLFYICALGHSRRRFPGGPRPVLQAWRRAHGLRQREPCPTG